MNYYGVDEVIKAMIGKTLTSVCLENNKERIVFTFADGSSQAFGVEGDCCSQSWIEHLEAPNDVNGAIVLGFSEDSADATEDDTKNPVVSKDSYQPREHESLQVYQSRFKTDRGEIVLEYRNSSNGYYGGTLVCL